MNKLYLLFGIVFLLSIGYAEAVCNTPSNVNQSFSANNQLIDICNGTYYINNSDINGQAIYYVSGSNITIRCNNTIMIGNGSGYGIAYTGGNVRNNNVVEGCTINNYKFGLDFTRQMNLTLRNNILYNISHEAIYVHGGNGTIIENNTVFNTTGIDSPGYAHCLYLSQASSNSFLMNNVIVRNNYFSQCNGVGLHTNSRNSTSLINNLSVYNNIFISNAFGFNNFGTNNSIYYNNTFINATQYGVRFGHNDETDGPNEQVSHNTMFINNIFIDNNVNGAYSGDIIFDELVDNDSYTRPYNISIINNTHIHSTYDIVIFKNNSEVFIDEVSADNYSIAYGPTTPYLTLRVLFNYPGRVIFNVTNDIINIQSVYPYNDIKNISNGVILTNNFINYNITTNATNQIEVGAFDCVVPVDNLNVNESMTLCGGTYYLNDSNLVDTLGVIVINASNVVLDCAGASIIGNTTLTGSRAISSNFNNITIKNCNITNYNRLIDLQASSHNALIQNVTLLRSNFGVIINTATYNVTIENSRFLNLTEYTNGAQNLVVRNNYFDGMSTGNLIQCMRIIDDDYVYFYNNTLTRCAIGINLAYVSGNINPTNIFIYNNTLIYNDIPIKIMNLSSCINCSIHDNLFINNTANYDTYNIGMEFLNTLNMTDFLVYNNNFTMITKAGILINNAFGIKIFNNSFDFFSIAEKANARGYNAQAYDKGDVSCAIRISEEYQGFVYSSLDNYINSNISIYNNTYDNDTQCYMLVQSIGNVTNDISDYWYRKILFNSTTEGMSRPLSPYEYYLSNNYDTITRFSKSGADSTMIIYNGSDTIANRAFNYTLSKTSITIKNLWNFNQVTSIYSMLTQSPNNDIKNTSNGIILANNVDNFTTTLSPDQQIEVGDFVTDYCTSNVRMVCDYDGICRDIITGCVVNATNTRSTIVWCANE